MDEIIKFTGDTIAESEPDDILDAAKGETQRCLVLGWQEDGELWFSASFSDVAEIVYLLETAKTKAMSWGRTEL